MTSFRWPLAASVPNEIVFFVITNIEHDVPAKLDDGRADMYLGATMGELGCWLDTAVTRVIQTGVEHARVPDVKAYIGAGEHSLTGNRRMNSLLA